MPNVPSDEEFLAYNQDVISEFRANQGVVSQPPFPILLLTTTGARTGRSATVPLGFAVDDSGRVFVVASKAGSPEASGVVPQPVGQPVGDGGTRRQVLPGPGRRNGGKERDRLYGMVSGPAQYEKNTDRVFPVIVLEGVPAPA